MLARTYRAASLAAALLASAPAFAQVEPADAAAAVVQADAEAAPTPPAGAAISFVPPARDEAGYRTPNRALSPEEATWHLRVALNVAALGCRGPQEAATAAAYNAVLTTHAATLAAAAAATEGRFRQRDGAAWQARYDDDMTRLYNFFAQPPVHQGFCATAEAVLRESATVEPGDFPAFAAAALPRLEAPFLAFFAAFDGYRASLASWKARHTTVVIATASAPAMGPVGPVAGAAAMDAPASPHMIGPQP